jgi:hypothetical protein
MQPTPAEQTPPPAPTPTRKAARIALQSDSRIGTDGKAPIFQSTILNVSMGGMLLFTHTAQKQDAVIQIELGAPVFPISRLVRARVAHVADAPEELLAVLHDKGKAEKKRKGFLIGVEFTHIDKDDRQTLTRFIRKKVREEQKRRANERGESDDARPRNARDRVVQLQRARVPRLAWLLGFLIGTFELITGIWQGADNFDIALHVGLALATFWFVGRIAAAVWNQLEIWRMPDATIVARTDGTASDLDEVLADADSELDLAPEDDEVEEPEATEQGGDEGQAA